MARNKLSFGNLKNALALQEEYEIFKRQCKHVIFSNFSLGQSLHPLMKAGRISVHLPYLYVLPYYNLHKKLTLNCRYTVKLICVSHKDRRRFWLILVKTTGGNGLAQEPVGTYNQIQLAGVSPPSLLSCLSYMASTKIKRNQFKTQIYVVKSA